MDEGKFSAIFQEMFGPKEGDVLAEATEEELEFWRDYNARAGAADTTLRVAQDHHSSVMKNMLLEREVMWEMIKRRLGDKWPKNGKVMVDTINKTFREQLR